jgi:hypothetical protein
MRKYRESLKNTRPVVVPKELHRVRIDYSALVKYAKQKGVEPSRLSDEEKNSLRSFSMRVYATKEKSSGDCSRRIDNIEVWSGVLLELVHKRIRQRLKEDLK